MIVKVGNDEFCSNCMDWREYDEQGRCKKCGKLIKKQLEIQQKDSYEQYKQETPIFEAEDEASDF
jgi:predicted amidophosphoribosyltransferase